jgi:hypothetical protein
MITTPKLFGLLAVAFVAGSFATSPELRAFAANTVFSTDIVDGEVKTSDLAAAAVTAPKLGANAVNSAKVADNSITAPDIGANAVGASEIATDAVGAAEIQGITKLLFGQCVPTDAKKAEVVSGGGRLDITCNITGVDGDDSVSATLNLSVLCFEVMAAYPSTDRVDVYLRNDCAPASTIGTAVSIAIIVYDK